MKRRLDQLAAVRRAGLSEAGATLARAAGAAAQQGVLAGRLDAAVATLALDTGRAKGAAFAAQLELAQRMRVAQTRAAAQLAETMALRDDAMRARKVARKAVETVAAMQQRARRDAETRRLVHMAPIRCAR